MFIPKEKLEFLPRMSQHPVTTSRNWFSKGSHLDFWYKRSSPNSLVCISQPQNVNYYHDKLLPMSKAVVNLPRENMKDFERKQQPGVSHPSGFSNPTGSLHLALLLTLYNSEL